jgi:hypothetical protein
MTCAALTLAVVTAAFSPLAHAQRMRAGAPGQTGPGGIGEAPPAAVPIDLPSELPGILAQSMLARPTSQADFAGTVMFRNNGRRTQYAVVTPNGEGIGQAVALGLTPAIGQPVTMAGVNTLVVGFTQDTDLAAATAFFRQNGLVGEVREQTLLRNVYTVKTVSALDAFQIGDFIGGNPAVRFAHPDMYAEVRSLVPIIEVRQGMTDISQGGIFDFGTTSVGAPVEFIFTITNSGDQPLSISAAPAPTGFSIRTTFPINPLPPAGSFEFVVRLDADSPGAQSGSLLILNNSAANPFGFTVTGQVDPPMGPASVRVTVDDDALENGGTVNFGATPLSTPIVKVFTIYNDGANELVFGSVTVPFGYTVTSQPVSPIAGGGNTPFIVQLDAASGGTFTGELSFLNNDADSNPFTAMLTGTVSGSGGGDIEDPLFPDQWHLANTGQGGGTPMIDIDVENAWLRTFGNGAIVALMDDGTQPVHPDYAGNLLACADCVNEFDFDNNVETGEGSHGTAVAGLIGAVSNTIGGRGVAPEVALVPTSFYGSTLDQANNFAAAAATGASVHNNSWGYNPGTFLPDVVRDTIIDLTDNSREGRGMLFLFSSANSYTLTLYGSALASMQETLGVGAVTNQADRSPYSNYGLGTDIVGPSNFGTRGIVTTDVTGIGGYNTNPSDAGGDYTSTFGGTSASSPIVAGLAGLAMSVNPELHAVQLKRLLMHTASLNSSRNDLLTIENRPFDAATSFSESYGYGFATASAAVQAALAATTNGGLTWPATVTNVVVNQGASMTSIDWTNPVTGPKGEYFGALVVRMGSPSWKPTDGVQYTVGQFPAQGVQVIAVGDISNAQDMAVTLANNATYGVFAYNRNFNYAFGVLGTAAQRDGNVVLFDNFETDRSWFATGKWQRGTPNQDIVFVDILDQNGDLFPVLLDTPPRTRGFNVPFSGSNCFATGLDSTYTPDTNHELFSPIIDLVGSNARTASISYWEMLELESNNPNTFVRVDVVNTDVNNPVVITQLRSGNPGNSYVWTPRSHDLTPQIGTRFRIRFTLSADTPIGAFRISQFQGWFLDDVRIATDGTVVQPPPNSRLPGLVRLPPPGGFQFFLNAPPIVPISATPDVNGDGKFDSLDVGEVLKRFGAFADDSHFDSRYDMNDDGQISMFDLGIVLVVAMDPSSYTPGEAPVDRR